MIINNEQFNKLMDLAELKISYENAVQDDITKALISIERKLLYSSTEISAFQEDFNILIVDDLELSIFQFNQLLKKVGIVPTVARTKTEALAELKKKSYDFVVVDLFLPDSDDGLALINECIKIKEAKNISKIIVMSGTDDKDLVEKIMTHSRFNIKLVGKPNLNSWNGTESAQLFIDSIEIEPVKAAALF